MLTNVDIKELIGRCAGHAVADTICALARALHCYSIGAVEPAVKDFAANQIERLLNLYSRARAVGLTLGSFGEAARHHDTTAPSYYENVLDPMRATRTLIR